MGQLATDSDIDWLGCELIEVVPGKVSGRSIVRGTTKFFLTLMWVASIWGKHLKS